MWEGVRRQSCPYTNRITVSPPLSMSDSSLLLEYSSHPSYHLLISSPRSAAPPRSPLYRPPPPCATLPFVLLLSVSVDHLDPVPLLILPLPPRSPTVDFAQWLRSLLHLQRRPHTTVQATRLQLVYKVIVIEPHLVRCSSVRCSSGQVLSG